METQTHVLHEIGDLGLGLDPISESDQQKLKEEQRKEQLRKLKEANKK
jgi:hypothetical protein